MATDVTDYTFGTPLRSAPDYIFDGVNLATAGDLAGGGDHTSEEFLLGKTQNALEIVFVAKTDITITEAYTFKAEYLYGDSFATAITAIDTITGASGNTTITAGTEIGRFVPPSGLVGVPGKIKITTSDTITGTMDTFAAMISR